jgi:hypothetical protein
MEHLTTRAGHTCGIRVDSETQCLYNALLSMVPNGPSALSSFNLRIEGLECGACVVDCELPIDPVLLL